MTFRLSFGAEPKLMFTFLRTYENIGSAILELNGNRFAVQGLDTTNKVSQSHTLWFDAKQDVHQAHEGMMFGFGVAPHSRDLALNVSAPGAKFKIISVISC
uniref:Uncharacterized protein n=1 Tax=Alexandrium catenella TaxID=2925 RepID=A0A6T9ES74_ALECA